MNKVVTTVANNPTLFFYVPKAKDYPELYETESGEFEILDQSGKTVYLSKFKIVEPVADMKDSSGIVKLALPKNISLATNEEYIWRFEIICDEWDRSSNEFVEGFIKKTVLAVAIAGVLSADETKVVFGVTMLLSGYVAYRAIKGDEKSALLRNGKVIQSEWRPLVTSNSNGELESVSSSSWRQSLEICMPSRLKREKHIHVGDSRNGS